MGLISPAKRTESGYRLYDEQNIERIHYIDRLKQIGLSRSEFGELFDRWGSGRSPREGMAVVRDAYRSYLASVQEKLAGLRAIEQELLDSLSYLEGCSTCSSHGSVDSECGPCVRNRTHEADTPNLLLGLVAH